MNLKPTQNKNFKSHTEITEITECRKATRGDLFCPAEMAEIAEIATRGDILFHTRITALELCSLATKGTQEITEMAAQS